MKPGLKTNFTRHSGRGRSVVSDLSSLFLRAAGRQARLVHAIALDGNTCCDGTARSFWMVTCFTGFCTPFLAPALNPGDLVVMDNLGSHKSESARLTIESVGAQVVLLLPYSPGPESDRDDLFETQTTCSVAAVQKPLKNRRCYRHSSQFQQN